MSSPDAAHQEAPAAFGGGENEFVGILSGPEWQPDDADGAPDPDAENTTGRGEAAFQNTPEDASGLPTEAASDGDPAPKMNDGSEEAASGKMTLMGHLNELRVRLIRCCMALGVAFVACWVVVDPIFDTLVNPLLAALPNNSTAIYTTLPEGFFTRMFVAFVTSVFAASPVIFYQLWSFIAPGLYEEEKQAIVPIAFVSAVFFVLGGTFCYFIVFPYAFKFFVSFSTEQIVVMPKVSDYLDFVLKLILAFGLIFEMPLFAFFLSRMGIVTAAMMRHARRYAVLAIFIIAAILTPPDVVSQLLMACPMLLLYEVSILVAAAFGRKKKSNETTTNPEET
ncbi:MAG: twin-arginine translocase subunit TatC [Desulfovibrio sp.]|jgi:sec-independent protein translocase protein TatC|nr:twin-arginine translocase subunit TatC [Desulfovibrio sp.]